MRLTTKGRYAVTALLDLAIQGEDKACCLADISARQGISLSYLEQLFGKLRKRGLVTSLRGPGGGYKLDHPCQDIYVADIISAVDEPIDATRCQGKADCQDGGQCITHELWSELSEQIQLFLSDISLADLVLRHHKKHGHNTPVAIDLNRIQTATVS